MNSLTEIEDKLEEYHTRVEKALVDKQYIELEECTENLLEIADNLYDKCERHYNKLEEIDEFLAQFTKERMIDYETFVWYLQRENKYDEFKDLLTEYMKFYNKIEEMNVWN